MVFQDQNRQKTFLMAAGIICAILQVGFAPHLHLFNGHPNFALIFAGLAMAVLPGSASVLCGFFAGVFFDLVGAGPFGLMAFALSFMNFLCGIDSAKRMGESWLETFCLFCLCAAGVEFFTLLGEVVAGAPLSASFFVGSYLFAVLLDCLFALPFFYVLGKLTSTASTGAGTSGASKYAENNYSIDSATPVSPPLFEKSVSSGGFSKKKKGLFGRESLARGRSSSGGSSFGGSVGGRSLDGAHYSGPGTSQKKTFRKKPFASRGSLGAPGQSFKSGSASRGANARGSRNNVSSRNAIRNGRGTSSSSQRRSGRF